MRLRSKNSKKAPIIQTKPDRIAPIIPSTPDQQSNQLALSTNRKLVALPRFKEGDVVWCKLKGWSKWPAIVREICGKHNQMVKLYWFNDYRVSTVHQGQLSKFTPSSLEPVLKRTKNNVLESAMKEATIYLMSKKIQNIKIQLLIHSTEFLKKKMNPF